MCELLGMSASYAADLATSLSLFRPRGGQIGPHADGWGLAFYEDHVARIFKEPIPASDSQCLAFLQGYDLTSHTVVAHIRKANPPGTGRSLANTHPFERELDGRSWVFAHNGLLAGLREHPLYGFHPTGATDSEYAFCLLLDTIRDCVYANGRIGDIDNLLRCLVPAVSRINELGELNFLLSNGEHMFVHTHTRLHMLHRRCEVEDCNQNVRLIATHPLTDESWSCLMPNTLAVLHEGRLIRDLSTSGPAPPEAWQRHFAAMASV